MLRVDFSNAFIGVYNGGSSEDVYSVIGIAIAIVGNVLINVALNIQRYAHLRLQTPTPGADTQDENSHGDTNRLEFVESTPNYLTSGFWWLGAVIMTVGEVGNFLAYGFAPASVVSPLGVFSLVSNCIIAPLFFGEKITRKNVIGVFIAIFGILFIIISIDQASSPDPGRGPTTSDPYKRVLETISQTEVVLYGVVSLLCICILLIFIDYSGERGSELHSLFTNLSLVAFFGAYTALSTKALSSMLAFAFKEAFGHFITYVLISVIGITAVLQVFFLNRALQCFDATTVVPIHFVLFTLSVVTGSAIVYHEFQDRDTIHTVIFFIGCLLTFIGVWLITSSSSSHTKFPSSDRRTPHSPETVHNNTSSQGNLPDISTYQQRHHAFPEIVISPMSSRDDLDTTSEGALVDDDIESQHDEHSPLISQIQRRTLTTPEFSTTTEAGIDMNTASSVPLTSTGMFIGTVIETSRGLKYLKSRSRSHNDTTTDNGNETDENIEDPSSLLASPMGTRKKRRWSSSINR